MYNSIYNIVYPFLFYQEKITTGYSWTIIITGLNGIVYNCQFPWTVFNL